MALRGGPATEGEAHSAQFRDTCDGAVGGYDKGRPVLRLAFQIESPCQNRDPVFVGGRQVGARPDRREVNLSLPDAVHDIVLRPAEAEFKSIARCPGQFGQERKVLPGVFLRTSPEIEAEQKNVILAGNVAVQFDFAHIVRFIDDLPFIHVVASRDQPENHDAEDPRRKSCRHGTKPLQNHTRRNADAAHSANMGMRDDNEHILSCARRPA